ncbi:hypothetical protein Dda_6110 [Drechslerella dactyloides]|uniref:Uncharacterized protein n=1 Tax=Drechslerella dactyloides TaxID=74499 RepID=A0AAD6IZF4_DREDA|nr:hypothetical protein Dda_6110 [Drechslerella dactyloides]
MARLAVRGIAMGSDKKMSFLKRAVTTAAINYNAFMALTVHVLCARFLSHQKLDKKDLTGKNAIVTGSNIGLGKGIAMHLAQMNATIYLACRNLKKAEAAREDLLKSAPNATIHILELDTSTIEGCRKFCNDWAVTGKTIDILMHNAGVGCPPSPDTMYGPDGFEHMYMTNFLSNVIMTFMLEKYLADDARIVMTSSPGVFVAAFTPDFAPQSTKDTMEAGFNYAKGQKVNNSALYSSTKLMQVCFARLLTQKYRAEGKGIVAHAFSPGYAASDFFSKSGVATAKASNDPIWWLLVRNVNLAMPSEEGCKTGVMLATDKRKAISEAGGMWFERMKPKRSPIDLYDDALLDRMWNRWCMDAGIHWDHAPSSLPDSPLDSPRDCKSPLDTVEITPAKSIERAA